MVNSTTAVVNARRSSYARQRPEIPSPHESFALKVLVFRRDSFCCSLEKRGNSTNELRRESGADHRCGQPPWDRLRHCPSHGTTRVTNCHYFHDRQDQREGSRTRGGER